MSTYKLNYTDSFVNRDAANSLCSNPENGFSDLSSFAQSEKAVQELLSQQTPMQATDDHLIVFSEGLRSMAVAKALRGAAEGKALAQVEAAEWKGRYELEKSRNLKLQHKECQNRQMEYLPRNSSMTISSPTQAHQVFLNYRGEQLRHNFISHLIDAFERHDINFVVDKYEQRGNDLKNLFVRIEESRIALAIFSTRYAESRWCMDELVKMKKLVDQEKLRVIPIFYKVKAQDVRGQEGEFGKNFWKLARKPSSSGDDIKNWKEALECISDKMGLSLRDKSSEAEFVKEIVKEVQRVNPRKAKIILC